MRHPEWGTEVILACRATTGDIPLQRNVAAMDLEYTWHLKMRLSDHIGTTSTFELRDLQDTAELDDSQRLRTYVQAGLLNVEIVMQTRRASTRRDEVRIGEMAGLQQATRLRHYLAKAIFTHYSNHLPYLEEETW